MAIVTIQFGCGCGDKYGEVEAATRHCEQTGHVLTVSGQVKPTEQELRIVKEAALAARKLAHAPVRQAPARKEAAGPVQVAVEAKLADFSSLRAKLHKR